MSQSTNIIILPLLVEYGTLASLYITSAAAAAKSLSRVLLCATPHTAAHQPPPSLGFSRQEHWSGLPFPSPMQESEK